MSDTEKKQAAVPSGSRKPANLLRWIGTENRPTSPQKWWMMLIALVVLYNITVIPVRIGFAWPATMPFYIIDGFLDLLLILDTVYHFFVPFELDGIVVHDRKLIAKNYMGTFGWFDILSAFPVDLFLTWVPAIGPQPALRANKLIRIVRMNNFFSLMENNLLISVALQRVMKLSLVAFLVAHYATCSFFWMIRSEDIASVSNYVNTDATQLFGFPIYQQYCFGFYFSIATMTGYGGFLPVTDTEALYTFILVLIGIAVFVVVIGTVGSIITNMDITGSNHRSKMEAVNHHMQSRNFPEHLRQRVRMYYSYLWKSRKGLDEQELLEDLPGYLRLEVALHINREVISKVPLFQGADPSFISGIIINLKPIVAIPNAAIVKKGEVGREMFFISRGEVEVVSEDGTVVYARLRAGQFFGEIALVTSGKRTATVRAAMFCDLFVLLKEDFDDVLADFPEQAKSILEAAETRYKILKAAPAPAPAPVAAPVAPNADSSSASSPAPVSALAEKRES